MKSRALHLKRTRKRSKSYRAWRAQRDLYKAWMVPTRLLKELWRWICFPFKAIRIIYWAITGKLKPVWDGG